MHSIRFRLGLYLVSILTAGFLILGSIISLQHYRDYMHKASALARETSGHWAGEVKSFMNSAILTCRGFRHLLLVDRPERSNVVAALRALTRDNPDFLGTWVLFEPNAYDGRDAAFRNTAGHDRSGRFVPYLARDGQRILLLPIEGYEAPTADNLYYYGPRQSGKEYVTDPYYYEIEGKPVFMMSLTVPVLDFRKRFIGAVGVDVTMQSLQERMDKIRPFDGAGFLSLISSNGVFATHGENRSLAGKSLADEESDPERAQWFREALASGKPFRDTAGGYIHYYHPFLVGEDPRPWVLRASLPVSVPRTAMLFKILEFGVGLLISLLIMAVTLNYIIRRNLLIPFEDIKSIMGAVASGDLKIARSEAARDEIGDIKRSIYLTVDGLTTIVTEVQEAVAQLEETSKMMAGSAQRFTDLSQGQASSAEESAASVEELTASAQMAATSVARSVDTVEDITQRVGTLNEHIVGINQEMRNLTEKSNRSAGQAREGETSIREATTAMGAIRESGSRITEILSIITSISDKTNLLSLNAAIEAARAGDAGRGFAVVADEISRLADQTAHSVKEIGQLIGTTGAAVENGHERVIRAAAVLQQIIDSTEEIDHLSHNVQDRLEHQRSNVSQIKDQVDALRSAAREIGHAMNEQKGATLEIGLTVSSISEGSQELSSGAGVLAGNAQHLQSQARRLARLLRRFRT